MKPLIRHCNALAASPKSHIGILSPPQGFRVAYLVFTDDCLMFAGATTRGARKVLKLLTLFTAASGQQVNFHKSSI